MYVGHYDRHTCSFTDRNLTRNGCLALQSILALISEAMKIVANSLGNRHNVDLFESDLDVEFLGGILSDATLHTLAEVFFIHTAFCVS